MSKKAKLIGYNYEGTDGKFKGCVNDIKRMYECFTERMGFENQNVNVNILIDNDEEYLDPTGVAIRGAITELVQDAEPDDVQE